MQSNSHNISKEDMILNNKYIIKDLISSGGTAVVFKCIDKETGQEKAAKFLKKFHLMDSNKKQRLCKNL